MQRLFITLSILFLSIVVPLSIDTYCNGCVTGRGLAGVFVLVVLVTAWNVCWVHRQAVKCAREEGLRRRAEAHKRVAALALNSRGEAEGDLTNWLVVVAVVAILFFLLSDYCSAADGAIPICGEPTGFQMMAVGLVGLVLLKRRTR
jgi:hypothetical protein